MSQFTEKFTAYSNTDLLRIIEMPQKYQPEAVETAITILNSRELSPQEYENAKTELASEILTEQSEIEKKQLFDDKVTTVTSSVSGLFNPLQKSDSFTDKGINLIAGCSVFLFVYYLYNGFNYFSHLLGSGGGGYTVFTSVFYLIDFIYFPIGALLLYKRKKAGWILILYFSISSIIGNIIQLKWKISYLTEGEGASGLSYSPIINIIFILLFISWFWFLSKGQVLKKYAITNKMLLFTIIISLALALLMHQRFF